MVTSVGGNTLQPCWKKTIEPCPKLNRKCIGFNGNVLVLMETIIVSTGM